MVSLDGLFRQPGLWLRAVIGFGGLLLALPGIGAAHERAGGESLPAGAHYVALGSSFAAGPGIPPPKPGNAPACGRSADNYATQVAARLKLTLTDVTCSGSTTADILTTPQSGQGPQIDAVTSSTSLVTMTIGGNDVNYLGSLFAYSCQNSGGTSCAEVDRAAMDRALTTVGGKIGAVITAVRDRAPDARILVVDYFTILPASGRPCTGIGLTEDEVQYELSVARRLRMATLQAVAAGHATLIDLAAKSIIHNGCADVPWVERSTTAPGRVPYHPNEAGMTAAANLILQRL